MQGTELQDTTLRLSGLLLLELQEERTHDQSYRSMRNHTLPSQAEDVE